MIISYNFLHKYFLFILISAMRKGRTDFSGKVYKEHGIKIIKSIGQGNWSDVYLAYNLDNAQKYAVKVIAQTKFKEATKIKELLEAQKNILKNCNNPNVVKLYKDFKEDEHQFLILQYCDGGDLGDVLDQEKILQQDIAIKYIFQILNGFKGLHKINAIHRDFKVQNVMLHEDCCKIVDLGFGKQLGSLDDVTHTKLGSNLTMAPEVMLRMPYGIKVDIWSIGVVFYQLLQGTYPFIGRNMEMILQKIKKNEIKFTKGEGEQAKDFIRKCLTVNPEQRIGWKQIHDHPLFKKFSSNKIVNNSQLLFKAAAQNKKYYEKESNFKISNIYKVFDSHIQQKSNVSAISAINQTTSLLYKIKIEKQLSPEKGQIAAKEKEANQILKFKSEIQEFQWRDYSRNYQEQTMPNFLQYKSQQYQNRRLIQQIQRQDLIIQQQTRRRAKQSQYIKNNNQQKKQNLQGKNHIKNPINFIKIYQEAVDNARYVSECLQETYLSIKDIVKDVHHQQYMAMLWKDAYLKLQQLAHFLVENNNGEKKEQKIRENFTKITIDLMTQAQTQFHKFADIAKKKNNNLDRIFMKEASKIEVEFQENQQNTWFDYICKFADKYWHELAKVKGQYPQLRQKLLKYIFCLSEFSRQSKIHRFSVKKLRFKISGNNFDYQKAQNNINHIMSSEKNEKDRKYKRQTKIDHYPHYESQGNAFQKPNTPTIYKQKRYSYFHLPLLNIVFKDKIRHF